MSFIKKYKNNLFLLNIDSNNNEERINLNNNEIKIDFYNDDKLINFNNDDIKMYSNNKRIKSKKKILNIDFDNDDKLTISEKNNFKNNGFSFTSDNDEETTNFNNFIKNKSDIIDILDFEKIYIYVLCLEYNKYYVGRTSKFLKRMYDHFHGNGSVFTKIFKPISILEIIEENDIYDEKNKTIEIMLKYGWENVRGYTWCQTILYNPPNIIKSKKGL